MMTNAKDTETYLSTLPDWQKKNLQLFQKLVHQASSDITEEIKWGVPVFMYKSKVLFAMSGFKDHTKYNFFQNGALIEDTDDLFNNGLESKKSRGIDIREGEDISEVQLLSLIKQAIGKM